jgi:hypothetical protein
MLCFELLNEVTDKAYCDTWNRVSTTCVKRIRAFAPDMRIIIVGYYNNSIEGLKDIAEPVDDKVVYTFHCYDPLVFTHQGAYWVDKMPSDMRLAYSTPIEDIRKKCSEIGLDGLCDFEHISVDKLCAQYFKDRFAEAERISKERDVPVYCGEYGVIELASAQDTLNWYKDICTAFDKYGFGRAAWCYKQMDFGISDKHLDSVREELLRYL